MSDPKFDKDDGLEIDIDTLIRENAQAVADYELTENPESNNQDLQDRQALRRVSGLSTELQDVSDAEYRQLRLEKVVLVGVWTEGSAKDADNSIKELAALAQTAGSQVMEALIQRRDKPDSATFIGSGKVKDMTSDLKNPRVEMTNDIPWARNVITKSEEEFAKAVIVTKMKTQMNTILKKRQKTLA